MAETAHFFSHGAPLSVYENACLASFQGQGFRVVLWSYTGLHGPAETEAADAREILPEEDLGRWTQAGVKGSLPAFSNAFRYQLLTTENGWWFDSDNVCLRPAADFAAIPVHRMLTGLESGGVAGTGVLRATDPTVAKLCVEELGRRGTVVEWGELGPGLVRNVLRAEGIDSVPMSYFYAVGHAQADLALRPGSADEFAERCRDSYSYHYWNEIVRRWHIPKDVLPPAGSFLHRRFIAALPEVASQPTLPVATLDALMAAFPQSF